MKTLGEFIHNHCKSIKWVIILSMIIGFLVSILILDLRGNARWRKQINTFMADFENPGKIVEIYVYRTGTKSANYQYPVSCIIQDKNGLRHRFYKVEELVVEGDYWNICLRDDIISLCELVKRSDK